jgi:hypothetical protein
MEFVVHHPDLCGEEVRVVRIAHEGEKSMSQHHDGDLTKTPHNKYAFAGLVSARELPHQAIEVYPSRQLPWPRNLFGELASIEELLAEAAGPTDASACGCRWRHRHDVS